METIESKFKPLYFVKNDDKETFVIVMGNTQVSPIEFNSVEEAEKYLEEQPYNVILDIITVLFYYYEKDNMEKIAKGNKSNNDNA